MSETVPDTAPQGGAPEAEPAETTAPVETPTETPVETAEEKAARDEKRFARLSARLTAAEQGRQQAVAEAEALRRGPLPPQAMPQTPEELERLIDARAEAKAAQRDAVARAKAFHEHGEAMHADWPERCQSLIQMGVDAGISQLLVEMKDDDDRVTGKMGARVADALHDDPEALQRIAAIKTERGRAIALGMYAAKLPEEKPAAVPRRPVSRAPAPIRPVNGTANPTFNEYTTDDASALAQHYMKDALEKRMRRN